MREWGNPSTFIKLFHSLKQKNLKHDIRVLTCNMPNSTLGNPPWNRKFPNTPNRVTKTIGFRRIFHDTLPMVLKMVPPTDSLEAESIASLFF
ncbi:hypothetical protein AVEN_185610-1 [Araneus ventricosus]|uniref:Uncharacterized protein n=1 Tax=Araneus ventricosus TaxID=182803 RepID=A0A4Y2RIW4_ARAVE|nr:hypothetical protein AVEN_185610-1 [Araneus ventricosus]